jgi:hypothetical protein
MYTRTRFPASRGAGHGCEIHSPKALFCKPIVLLVSAAAILFPLADSGVAEQEKAVDKPSAIVDLWKGHPDGITLEVAQRTVDTCVKLLRKEQFDELRSLHAEIGDKVESSLWAKDASDKAKPVLGQYFVVISLVTGQWSDGSMGTMLYPKSREHKVPGAFDILQSDPVRKAYIAAAQGKDIEVRYMGLEVLRYAPKKAEVIDAVAKSLLHDNFFLSMSAGDALGELIETDCMEPDAIRDLADKVMRAYRKHSKTPAISGLLEAVAALGPACKALEGDIRALLRGSSGSVGAAYALARIRPDIKDGVTYLAKMIESDSPRVVYFAGKALEALGTSAGSAYEGVEKNYPEETESDRKRKKTILNAIRDDESSGENGDD